MNKWVITYVEEGELKQAATIDKIALSEFYEGGYIYLEHKTVVTVASIIKLEKIVKVH